MNNLQLLLRPIICILTTNVRYFQIRHFVSNARVLNGPESEDMLARLGRADQTIQVIKTRVEASSRHHGGSR